MACILTFLSFLRAHQLTLEGFNHWWHSWFTDKVGNIVSQSHCRVQIALWIRKASLLFLWWCLISASAIYDVLGFYSAPCFFLTYKNYLCKQKKRHGCIEQSFGLCGRRRGWDVSREQHRGVYYLGWSGSPAQVGCMRQALGPGALGRPRGIGWRGRWEGGSGWGAHVNPWLFHFNVWQNPLQYKINK